MVKNYLESKHFVIGFGRDWMKLNGPWRFFLFVGLRKDCPAYEMPMRFELSIYTSWKLPYSARKRVFVYFIPAWLDNKVVSDDYKRTQKLLAKSGKISYAALALQPENS